MRKIESINCLIIKIGSSIISDRSESINITLINNLATEIAKLKKHIPNIIIVSSGAVAAGFRILGFNSKPTKIVDKQAAAAVGQAKVIQAYEDAFKFSNINVAQILITKDDLSNRKRFLNAKRAIIRLLEFGVIPIINENDTILVDELKYIESFGDNDNLSALIASIVDASLLLILSDVDGLYTSNPLTNSDAKIINELDGIDAQTLAFASEEDISAVGSGGMRSKLLAARKANRSGTDVAIISGLDYLNISRLFNGDMIGTYIYAPKGKKNKKITSKKAWIADAAIPKGVITIDNGAVKAIKEKKSSLLPKGILDISGKFYKDDIVSIADIDNIEIGRGKTRYSSSDLLKIKQRKSSEIKDILGFKLSDEVIDRDDLTLVDD